MGVNEDQMPPLYIDKAYIDSLTLNIDLLDKIRQGWDWWLDAVGKVWDRLLGIPPTAESITDEEVENVKK